MDNENGQPVIALQNNEVNVSSEFSVIDSEGNTTEMLPSQLEELSEFIQVYPSVEELCTRNNSVKCTVSNCNSVFSSESNLSLHLIKSHQRLEVQKSDGITRYFYCPNTDCDYNKVKFFKCKKLLKQHYLKTHSPKTYVCSNCHKGFSTDTYLKLHIADCGIKFQCSSCDNYYNSYEGLQTHGRRKKHAILDKSYFKSKSESQLSLSNQAQTLPVSASVEFLAIPLQITNDQSIQTETNVRRCKSKLTQVHKDPLLFDKVTQHTQARAEDKQHLTVETQTIGDFFDIKSMPIIFDPDVDRKTVDTQTKLIDSKNNSCNTFININELDFSLNLDPDTYSSGTQTHLDSGDFFYCAGTNTHETIQADTSDLLPANIDNLDAFDSTFFNTETQTDIMFDDDLLEYYDYYTNYNSMHTQTSDDMWLNTLGFNHIETQTPDDSAQSVQSQTAMSHNKRMGLAYRGDTNHMETQTDLELKQQMLEEINA